MASDSFEAHVIDTLARLDTKMSSLLGVDGRVTMLEKDVDDLKRVRWTIGGIATGISITISSIIHFLFKH